MLQPPSKLRDTFQLLSGLGPSVDLDGLVDRVDWSGVTPQQVSYATLGRLPQEIHYSGLAEAVFEPQAYFKALLLGPDFQAGLIPNLLNAFPEKARRFFVHVPRSGGTSLGETLSAHACTIHYNSIGADWSGGHGFLESIADICRNIPLHDAIHVSGHYTLRSLIDDRLARFGDHVWTSVRAPQQIILSYLNYVLTILEADQDLVRPDTRQWAKQINLDGPVSRLSPERLRALLPRMIRDETMVPRDILCHFLGDGTAPSALDLLAAADVEVIDSTRLDQWREQQWNIPARPWANVSRNFFRWDSLDGGEKRQISALSRQDALLYQVIAGAFGAAPSVRGLNIVKSAMQPGLPASLLPPIQLPENGAPVRVRRAARPILLDPSFRRVPARHAGAIQAESARVGWADPPLNYRTIETTLKFPMLQTRIRIRYARRKLRRPGLWPNRMLLRGGLHRLFGRLGMLLAR